MARLEPFRTGKKRLPKKPLTHTGVERLLARLDLDTAVGLRDRAMVEIVYSCGLRLSELWALDLVDVDLERRIVLVQHGKGDKNRLIPVGERAVHWMERYLAEVRPKHARYDEEPALFLSIMGRRLSKGSIQGRMHKLGHKGGVHRFRHTAASLMLEGGADLSSVQAMLGHANIDTTKIYTYVTAKALKKVHEKTHPAPEKEPKRPESKRAAQRRSVTDVSAILQKPTDPSNFSKNVKKALDSTDDAHRLLAPYRATHPLIERCCTALDEVAIVLEQLTTPDA